MAASEPVLTDESVLAARDAALDTLGELVRYVRRLNGFMSEPDQQLLRYAQAMLVESGRKI